MIDKLGLNFFKSQIGKERLFFVVVITLLVVIWFQKGLIIGSGESGLPFYHPPGVLKNGLYNWSDTPFGDTGIIGYASLPFYLGLNLFYKAGIPLFIIQAFMFWLVFLVGVLSVHKISTFITDKPRVRLSAGLFYIFNPIVHVLILHRVQYPDIFFYGFFPITFLLFYQGLKSRNFLNLLIINMLSIIFSSVFVGPAFLELVFFNLGLLVVVQFFGSLIKGQKNFFPLIYLAVFILTFSLVNMWWITPMISTFFIKAESSGALVYFDPSNNISTFHAISLQLKSIISVFRLTPAIFYEGNGSTWGWIYTIIPFVLLSFFSLAMFIISLLHPPKNFLFRYLIILSLLLMFFMKGDLPPFGEISTFLFKTFTFLQVYRNPFEKISALLPFAMAIPVGIGIDLFLELLTRKLTQRVKLAVTVTVLLVIFPIFMFPIVNGLAFTGGGPPADNPKIGQYVKVPDYYKDARDWLNSQKAPFRVLALPLNGEGMTYNWEYGYAGVELSNALFEQPFISFSTGQRYLPELIYYLQKYFYQDPSKIVSLAQFLNIRYIMVRSDIDFQQRGADSPQSVNEKIKTSLGTIFPEVAVFGSLRFYEITPSKFNQKIYAQNNPKIIQSLKEGDLSLLSALNLSDKDLLIYPFVSNNSTLISENNIVVQGKRIENIVSTGSNISSDFSFIRFSPNSILHKLVLLKETLDLSLIENLAKPTYQTYLMGKRLAEMQQYNLFTETNLDQYIDDFNKFNKDYFEFGVNDRDIADKLISQKNFLNSLDLSPEVTKKVQLVSINIDKFLEDSNYKSIYPTKKSTIYRFIVSKPLKYELLISRDSWEKFYKEIKSIEFDLDGKTYNVNLNQSTESQVFNLGTFNLGSGLHEVSFNEPVAQDLVDFPQNEEFQVISKNQLIGQRNFPLSNFDYDSTFEINFEYLSEKGNDPIITVVEDTDPIDKYGVIQPRIAEIITRDNYDFTWKNHTIYFKINPNTQKAAVYFNVLPWGNCKAAVKRSYQKYCEDPEFRQKFLKDSVVKFRNLKVTKLFNNPAILRSQDNFAVNSSLPNIDFKQISPARYKVQITDAKSPYFLNLATAYDSRWRAYTGPLTKNAFDHIVDSYTGNQIDLGKHYLSNGFSNSWLIDKEGSYEIYLEFLPEKYYQLALRLSLTIAIIYLLIIITNIVNKKFFLKFN